jgi:alkylmercury lyase
VASRARSDCDFPRTPRSSTDRSATPIDTADIAAQLACCTPGQDGRGQRVQLALFRLLAEGDPVEPAPLAARAGVPVSEVADLLGRWWGVQTEEGRVVAFRGLSIREAPHRLEVDGRTLYTWCAWDTLFLPELIGRPAAIESTCPVTGAPVSLRIGSGGPAGVSPPGAVLSFIRPAGSFGDDVIENFCRFVHFFASPEAAATWTDGHPGTFVISIEQGFEIGRRTNAAQWAAALPRAARRRESS